VIGGSDVLARIIVAYDGSALAREAFALSLTIAAAAPAGEVAVLAVRAIEPTPLAPLAGAGIAVDPYMGLPAPVIPSVEEIEAERAAARRGLDELAAEAAGRGVRFESRVMDGTLSEVLAELSAPNDLIAVGQFGRFRRSGFGSAMRELVEHGPCPLLVVSGAVGAMNRVIAAFDGSGEGKRAVQWACELAEQTSWPLSVLAVSGPDLAVGDAVARAEALAPGAHVVHFGSDARSEAEQIEAAAGHSRQALLVIGAYADSWLHQFFFGGTTGHVLRNVQAPVVLIR
jgi:nucleotide-binding universal stress UspA family protein